MESVLKAITRPLIVNGENCTDVKALIDSVADGEHIKIQLNAVKQQKSEPVQQSQPIRVLTANDM